MSKKCPDPELQFDVDEAILEYLVYITTAALLQDAPARGKDEPLINQGIQVDLALQMVDCKVTSIILLLPDTSLTNISLQHF